MHLLSSTLWKSSMVLQQRNLISSGGQWTCLTGIKHYVSMMWTNKLLFSVTLWWTWCKTLFLMKLSYVMTDSRRVKKEIKQLTEQKNRFYDSFEVIKLFFISINLKRSFLIEKSKNNYFSKSQKLSHKTTSSLKFTFQYWKHF